MEHKVHMGAQKVCGRCAKGAERCMEGCAKGAWRCTEGCAKGAWRCAEGCAGGAGARAEWAGGAGVVGAGPVQRKSKVENFRKIFESVPVLTGLTTKI